MNKSLIPRLKIKKPAKIPHNINNPTNIEILEGDINKMDKFYQNQVLGGISSNDMEISVDEPIMVAAKETNYRRPKYRQPSKFTEKLEKAIKILDYSPTYISDYQHNYNYITDHQHFFDYLFCEDCRFNNVHIQRTNDVSNPIFEGTITFHQELYRPFKKAVQKYKMFHIKCNEMHKNKYFNFLNLTYKIVLTPKY